jgi:hypothetical protein
MGFDFAVEHKPGASNTTNDAPSQQWKEEAGELAALTSPTFMVLDTLHALLEVTATLRQVREEVVAGGCADKWRVVDGLITKASKVYVPTDSPHLPVILSAVHDMGHKGTEKTLYQLRRDFYVPSARYMVQEHVCACAVCQRNNVEQLHPAGLLQPLDVPGAMRSHIAMDFMEGFPRINDKSAILTVVDRFS